MTLAAGTRVGAYEVIGLLGTGGMGEVYRALDTRLKRDVALKVLPASVAGEAERLLRFAREAEMLAALNHPNIASIYGVEEADGVRALVMELVEGETLAEQIARGPVPLTEAIAIARQIAVALEAAHEQGIVHRDLKPANIKLRDDGTVKVLDFGLAKLADPIAAAAGTSSMSLSPTITSPALMTNGGMLLGTAAYMSPEQAKGRPADKRSDLWAFGCVVFEMLTQKRAFEGEDVSETLAAVLRGDPDWSALPAETPPAIRTLMRRCMERDRRKRVADSAAALFALDEYPSLVAPAPAADRTAFQQELDAAVRKTESAVERRANRRLLGAALAAVLLAGAASGATWWVARPPSPRVSYLAMPPSTAAAPALLTIGTDVAITSDGGRIVYQTAAGNATSVAVRALDQTEPVALGVSGGGPFLSPDNEWVGFYNVPGNSISKVSILGGPVVPVATGVLGMRGASWAPDDTIIFGAVSGGLWRVPASGGKPTALTETPAGGSERHNWPSVLPGGRAVVFTSLSTTVDDAQIGLHNLQTKETRIIIPRGTYPRYSKTGHLLYAAAGTLFAVGFDLDRLKVTTAPVPLIEGVVTKDSGAADFAIADNGTLVYIRGSSATSNRAVVWIGRDGRPQAVPGISPGDYRSVRVAPDGLQAVFEEGPEGSAKLWIYDVARATRNPLATGPGYARSPLWTPDGRRIVFASNRDGKSGIFAINADGTGQVDRVAIVEKAAEVWPAAWSSDGKKLIVSMNSTMNGAPDIVAISLPDGKTEPIADDTIVESHPAISANGEWIAYMAVRSGRPDVYVERFPARSDRRTVSTDGGLHPSWSADRRELYYYRASSSEMMVVPLMALSPQLVLGPPKLLFKVAMPQGRPWRIYDIMPDGRFIMIVRSESRERDAATPTLNVVQNWAEELKRRVPVR
ncbi:MAG TPA: protein kinase [Vicinamibacterales bacterium]|nr:protein kinase [Vicinamibacterales bacterium]